MQQALLGVKTEPVAVGTEEAPPQEEAKAPKVVLKRPASAPRKAAKAPKVSKAASAPEATATPAEEVMFNVRNSLHQQLLKRSLSDELLKRSASSFWPV